MATRNPPGGPVGRPKKAPGADSKVPVQPLKKKALDLRTKAFTAEYIANGGNGTQAAIKVGYSKKVAAVIASKLVKTPKVKAIIAKHHADLEAALVAKHGVTIDNILTELGRLALGDVRQLYHPDGTMKKIHELDANAAAMVAGFEEVETDTDGEITGRTKKVRLWDKNTALTNAMKHLGLFEKDNGQGKEITVTISADDAGVL